MDFVHGIISIRFAGALVRYLCFHFFTYVVSAVSENDIWEKEKHRQIYENLGARLPKIIPNGNPLPYAEVS